MNIIPVPTLKDNYVWTLIDKDKNSAIVVDPGEASPVRNYLQQHHLQLSAILVTHHHWDHTNGILDLKKIYQVPVFGPSKQINGVDFIVKEKEEVSVENFPIKLSILNIPGHTLDHIAYYAKGIIFCGDTLFAAGCGRLFEGSAKQMYHSLQKLASFSDSTKIYCAHEYTLNNLRFAKLVEPNNKKIAARIQQVSAICANHEPSLPSSLLDEKETNPFLRCHLPDVIASIEAFAGHKLNDAVEVFAWLRRWKDEF